MPREGGSTVSAPGLASFPGEATLATTHWNPAPSEEEWREEAGARAAEAEWALERMGEVAGAEEREGAVLEFSLFLSGKRPSLVPGMQYLKG